jgi:hypothetical protein
MENENQFFAVKGCVDTFTEAKFRTLCKYDEMIERFFVIIPILGALSIIFGLFAFSFQALMFGVGIGISVLLYSYFIEGTKLSWLIRSSIIYFIFEFKIDIEVDEIKNNMRNELWDLKDVISEMENHYDSVWKGAGKKAQDIMEYSIKQ